MIVADTNTLAYLYFPSRYTADITALLVHDDNWAAPRLWRSEFRNILATYMAERAIPVSQALEIQRQAESLMAGNEFEVDSASVLILASQSGCTAYDCELVHLAQSEGTHLITADRKLLRRFPDTAISASNYLKSYG